MSSSSSPVGTAAAKRLGENSYHPIPGALARGFSCAQFAELPKEPSPEKLTVGSTISASSNVCASAPGSLYINSPRTLYVPDATYPGEPGGNDTGSTIVRDPYRRSVLSADRRRWWCC